MAKKKTTQRTKEELKELLSSAVKDVMIETPLSHIKNLALRRVRALSVLTEEEDNILSQFNVVIDIK